MKALLHGATLADGITDSCIYTSSTVVRDAIVTAATRAGFSAAYLRVHAAAPEGEVEDPTAPANHDRWRVNYSSEEAETAPLLSLETSVHGLTLAMPVEECKPALLTALIVPTGHMFVRYDSDQRFRAITQVQAATHSSRLIAVTDSRNELCILPLPATALALANPPEAAGGAGAGAAGLVP